jgi:hypothetical protein
MDAESAGATADSASVSWQQLMPLIQPSPGSTLTSHTLPLLELGGRLPLPVEGVGICRATSTETSSSKLVDQSVICQLHGRCRR